MLSPIYDFVEVAQIGTITSAMGVGLMLTAPTTVLASGLDAGLQSDLSQGTTQVVMAVFIVMLAACVVYLFYVLMQTIDKGHKERDTREKKFTELLMKMELALQENTTASKESIRINQQCVDAMTEMKTVGKECREQIIRASVQ